MKKIPLTTIFIGLTIPFILIAGLLMMQNNSARPIGAPVCYKELVCDTSQIFSGEKLKLLNEYQANLHNQYDIDLRILTGKMTPSETINFFKVAKVGEKSKLGYGALLMLDTQSGYLRFQVTANLSAVYPNSLVSHLEQSHMTPYLRANQMSLGVVAATDMIVTRVKDALDGKQFSAPPQIGINLSSLPATLMQDTNSPERGPEIVRPTEVVANYHRVLEEGNTAYNLDIYSSPTQYMRRHKPVTQAEMRAELSRYGGCQVFKEVYVGKNLAAVLYNIDQRHCAPYFLTFKSGAWRLDLPTTKNSVLVNNKGEWYLDMSKPLVYMDAFLDWEIDKKGYPHPMRPMRWGLLIESDIEAMVTYVKKIYAGTPAVSMGFEERDVILEWAGIKSPTNVDVSKMMTQAENGQKISILLWRNGKKLAMEIVAPPRLEQ